MRIIQENAKDLWRNRVCALFIPGVMLGMAFSWCYGKKYVAYAGILSAYYLAALPLCGALPGAAFFLFAAGAGNGSAGVVCPVGYGGARPGGAALFLLGWILRGHLFYHAGPEIRRGGTGPSVCWACCPSIFSMWRRIFCWQPGREQRAPGWG